MISRSSRIAAVALCCSCSALLATAGDASSLSRRRTASPTQTAQVQSLSGRIRSVEGNTFTLETIESQAFAGQEQQEQEKEVIFTVDQDTAIEGRIEVGSNADVTYRKTQGNNIATSVRVTPQS